MHANELHKSRGFCLWLTGLSGAGKSTIAQATEIALHNRGRRTTMLDGDVVRTNLSKGLGFSKEDREVNISRVAFVASEVVHHHGVAICALISPYKDARDRARSRFPSDKFIEIYVSTPLEICEQRDPKGLYRNSRAGLTKNFTGLTDVYEAPVAPEITLNTHLTSIDSSVDIVLDFLSQRGLI
jgi:sulfate adenylyltransferase